jgi:hypothetical protein
MHSALLPPKAYDNPHLWNKFMRVTKHFLWSIFRYMTYVWHIFLPSYVRIFVSCNISHIHLNIMIYTLRFLEGKKKQTFEPIHSKFYETKALTSTFNKNLAEFFSHMHDLWPQKSKPTTGTHVYLRLQIIIQNKKNIQDLVYIPATQKVWAVVFKLFKWKSQWQYRYNGLLHGGKPNVPTSR